MDDVKTERELKLALASADQLPLLLAVLPPVSGEIHQRNIYFADAAGRTLDRKVMVRVRESRRVGSAPTVTLTVKRRLSREAGVFVSEEHEAEVSPEAWESMGRGKGDPMGLHLAPLEALRELSGISQLHSIGEMSNRRLEVALGPYLLEVDRTDFPDGSVDVEVEVETSDPEDARRRLMASAARAGVTLGSQSQSKFLRFLIRSGQVAG